MTHHSPPPRPSGEGLATAVRALASDARRVLSEPPGRDEARELSARIAGLEGQIDAREAGLLARWLENLRRRVDSHHRAEPMPSPPAGGASTARRPALSHS